MPIPPPGDSSEEMRKLETSAQRSYESIRRESRRASEAAIEDLERMAESGDESTKKIVGMMKNLAAQMRYSSRAGAQSFADELEGVTNSMDAQLGSRAKAILRENLQHFARHGVDVSRAYGRMFSHETVSGYGGHLEAQIGRVGRLKDIASQHGVSDTGGFAAQSLARGSEGRLNYFQQMKDAVSSMAARSEISGEEAARQTVHWNKLQSEEVMRTTRSAEKNQLVEAKKASARIPLAAAASSKGLGGDMLRGLLGTSLGEKMFKGENVRAEGGPAASKGIAGSAIAAAAGEGAGAMAGLINALAPLGVEMAIVSGVFETLFMAFDRTKKTGAAAFMAASTGARVYGGVLSGIARLGPQVNAATDYLRAGSLGANIDEMNIKSLQALNGMGTVAGKNDRADRLGGLTAAMDEIQAVGQGAGMSAEEAMSLAGKGQRTFNLNSADKMLEWFRKLRAAGRESRQSLTEFVGSMGNFTSLATQFGDHGDSIMKTMSAMSSKGLAAGLSQTGTAAYMGAGAGLAGQSLNEMLALNIAGHGGRGGMAGAAERLLDANKNGGAGGIMNAQMASFQGFMALHPGLSMSTTDPKQLAVIGNAVATIFHSNELGKQAFFDQTTRSLIAGEKGDLSDEEIGKTIKRASTEDTEAIDMLAAMDSTKDSLTQLVGIVRETAVMIAESMFFKNTEAGKYINSTTTSSHDRSHVRDNDSLHGGKKGRP